MAKELGPIFTTTGTTVRGMLFNQSGQVRDVVHAAWDTWTDGDVDDYDIAISELGTSGIYYGDAPSGVTVDAGEYDLVCYAGSVSLANIRTTFAQRKVGATNANITHIANDAASLVTEFDTNITKINGETVALVESFDANVTAMAANVVTASALATDAVSEIAAGISIPSAATVAAQVRTELTTELAHITLAKKILKNRTETNPATGIMTVYDDDGTTPLYTANIYADVAAATPYDSTAGVNRRDALA